MYHAEAGGKGVSILLKAESLQFRDCKLPGFSLRRSGFPFFCPWSDLRFRSSRKRRKRPQTSLPPPRSPQRGRRGREGRRGEAPGLRVLPKRPLGLCALWRSGRAREHKKPPGRGEKKRGEAPRRPGGGAAGPEARRAGAGGSRRAARCTPGRPSRAQPDRQGGRSGTRPTRRAVAAERVAAEGGAKRSPHKCPSGKAGGLPRGPVPALAGTA